jgi:eukaryotic-like serine/threonine-protein kinase
MSHYTLGAMANSPARAPIDVGSVIAGTYKIEALLGRGGMGAVFLASHQRLAGKQVAIKILHTEIEDTDVVARFKREAEIAARLNHPNIVGVIDYNLAADGTPYLVLDYLQGETLAQCIARGPLPLDQVVSIVRQIGSALAAAHRAGIVHRDLKPQNIFLVPTEVDGRMVEIAKVLDFGISKIRGSQTVKTQDSALLGTPQYMAPEQATGQHASVDERTDVFALGAIVYEMLSGRPAFAGASIPEVVFKVVYEQPVPLVEQVPSVPPAVEAAVAQAMAKPSDQRFPTVSAFVEAVTGQPVTLSRGPVAAPPAGAESPSALRRVTTGDAFARTMGSGNHGDSPVATAVPAAPLAPVPPTVDLRAADRGEPRRRPTAAILAIAIAGAAVAGGGIYFAMQRPAAVRREPVAMQQPGERPVAASGTPHAAAAGTAPADDQAGSPPPPVVAAQPSAPGPDRILDQKDPKIDDRAGAPATATAQPALSGAPTRPHGDRAGATRSTPHPPAPIDAPSDADADPDARDKLQQAEAALAGHDYDRAERLANGVINSSASARQRASARLVHGTVQCAARNDQETAQIDLRALDGFRALRARLLTVCRRHGMLTEQ